MLASGGARRREPASAIPALARPPARTRVVVPVSRHNKGEPRDLSMEPSYVGAHEDARDEEMLAARRAIKEAEAARPHDRARVSEACEACEEIRVRKQREREMRAALEVASIPFEAEQQALVSDESADEEQRHFWARTRAVRVCDTSSFLGDKRRRHTQCSRSFACPGAFFFARVSCTMKGSRARVSCTMKSRGKLGVGSLDVPVRLSAA